MNTWFSTKSTGNVADTRYGLMGRGLKVEKPLESSNPTTVKVLTFITDNNQTVLGDIETIQLNENNRDKYIPSYKNSPVLIDRDNKNVRHENISTAVSNVNSLSGSRTTSVSDSLTDRFGQTRIPSAAEQAQQKVDTSQQAISDGSARIDSSKIAPLGGEVDNPQLGQSTVQIPTAPSVNPTKQSRVDYLKNMIGMNKPKSEGVATGGKKTNTKKNKKRRLRKSSKR